MRVGYAGCGLAPSEFRNYLPILQPELIGYLSPTKAVPKKAKNVRKQTAAETHAAPAASKVKAEKQRRTGAKAKTPSRKKPSRAVSRKTGTSGAQPAVLTEPTEEQIRLRAYYISERRRRLALPGDASSDWLEAKRQLLSESRGN
jgi:hypothetical protein